MVIKTQEKQIINLLQCLVQSGLRVLVDYVREQLLDHYVKIENKHGFRNNGLLYLLGLYDKDVAKMISLTKQQTVKLRSKKLKQKQDGLRK
jgi:hypothetical protein